MGKRSQHILKDLYCCYRPTILVLVETKTSGPHADVVYLNMGFKNWFRVEAIGMNGGI